MGIKIYTYANPYFINQEEYWDQIKNSPIFTASHTLANSMRMVYKNDINNINDKITAISKLLECLYDEWFSVDNAIKQHAAIDNTLEEMEISSLDDSKNKNLNQSFSFNRDDVFKSIRVLFELGVNYDHVNKDKISKEQLYLLELYKNLKTGKYSDLFDIPDHIQESRINQAIEKALEKCDFSDMDTNTIVIQGVHQFTPIMLKGIEEIAKYKTVILIFNYQSQFKSVFQTWVNVYSTFEQKISFYDGKVSFPSKDAPCYDSFKLANNFGKLIEGKFSEIESDNHLEIIEFDNIMEFASYVADVYQKAKNIGVKNDKNHKSGNYTKYMNENFYSAEDTVNRILKMYYPDDFKERHFLDYPLGQFFVSIINMWDPETNTAKITDLNVIKECFSSKIISEDRPGDLITLYQKALPLFEGCSNLEHMIKKLKRVKRSKNNLTGTDNEYLQIKRVSYLDMTVAEMDELLKGLEDLNDITEEFFDDFKNGSTSFKMFYKNIRKELENKLDDYQELDTEFISIIKRVLQRLDQVENIEANASYQCLRSTMSLYLQQEESSENKTSWIVRNFEQIDGDILYSRYNNQKIYHFSCLNDDNFIGNKLPTYSWPLNDTFFVDAQEPSDWKYMAYITAKDEYTSFKRYALFYGLLFNKGKYKLSYIKHNDDQTLEMYYLIKILNPQVIKYSESRTSPWIDFNQPHPDIYCDNQYNNYDYAKYKICHYKFLLESLIEHNTVYKDSFLIKKYLEVIVENNLKKEMNGKPISQAILRAKVDNIYDELKNKFFPFVNITDEIDIKKQVFKNTIKSKARFFKITPYIEKEMNIKELFIHDNIKIGMESFKDVLSQPIEKTMDGESLYKEKYYSMSSEWCKFCPNSECCGKKTTINRS